jgi:flagellar basal body rod protein FlgG
MASGPRSSGIFTGLVLITIGGLFLLQNYAGIGIGRIIAHWWPLILIFWGVVKIYERTVAHRQGRPGGWITPGEVFLVISMFVLVGGFVAWQVVREHIPPDLPIGNSYSYDVDVAPKTVPADARITIQTGRGNLSVRSSDVAEIRVSGKKNVRTWNEKDADRLAQPLSAQIVQQGDAYEVKPAGFDPSDSRFSLDLDVVVPKRSPLTLRNENGDITVADMNSDVAIAGKDGNIEISDTSGNVSVETRKGDVKVTDTKGDLVISNQGGRVGGEVEAVNVGGSLTINGEFYGPIRAEKVAKGVRFVSQRSDLTLTQLPGHMETGSGNFEIVDAPGNITLRTSSNDIDIENPAGKLNITNRSAAVNVRFSSVPKDEVDITNSSGEITLTIPASSNFEIQADCHSCDIDSDFSSDTLKKTTKDSGDSHLEGKYGSGRGPKIVLKTSYGSISIRKTS